MEGAWKADVSGNRFIQRRANGFHFHKGPLGIVKYEKKRNKTHSRGIKKTESSSHAEGPPGSAHENDK